MAQRRGVLHRVRAREGGTATVRPVGLLPWLQESDTILPRTLTISAQALAINLLLCFGYHDVAA